MFFKKFTQHHVITPSQQLFFENTKNYKILSLTNFLKKKYYLKFLLKYVFSYFTYFFSTNISYFFLKNITLNSLLTKTFIINYKRFRFFPTLTNSNYKHTYISLSLGLFKSFFLKPKSFKKSKQLYLLSAHFFRKLFIFTRLLTLKVVVKYVPKYLSEILNVLLQSVTNDLYPVHSLLTTDTQTNNMPGPSLQHPNTTLKHIMFIKTKHYGFLKTKKRGKVKRKVSRKVIKNNNITD
jgi:hypothetical protein